MVKMEEEEEWYTIFTYYHLNQVNIERACLIKMTSFFIEEGTTLSTIITLVWVYQLGNRSLDLLDGLPLGHLSTIAIMPTAFPSVILVQWQANKTEHVLLLTTTALHVLTSPRILNHVPASRTSPISRNRHFDLLTIVLLQGKFSCLGGGKKFPSKNTSLAFA